MLLENLPSELILEIFSYINPLDLYISILPLFNTRLTYLITQLNFSLDLTSISYRNFLFILKYCLPSQIYFLRLTNQYSHGLLINEFFSSNHFHIKNFSQLRSLHLNDIIGNEIDCLPPYLEKLYIKFHKKAKYASKFYQLALQSTTLKQCYLIGGYAFDSKTCSHISSTTIQQLHMAIKTFPNDLIILLQSLPCLMKLKTRIYTQSSGIQLSSSFISPLRHLNIDLHGSGISLISLDSQLLVHLPDLQSLIYHSSEKSNNDHINHLIRLSTKIKSIKFIQKIFLNHIDIKNYENFNHDLILTQQEINHSKNSRRTFMLHTIPYPEKILSLPFIQWNQISNSNNYVNDEKIYDRVERIRINLSDLNISSKFPICRHVKHLTLISTNENFVLLPSQISSFICLSSIHHLIINSQTYLTNLNQLFSLMLSLHSLDITWSQLRSNSSLKNIKNLSLISECISWKEIKYLISYLMPQLEHLQINVTTSDECQNILNILLSPRYKNNLISIKICICQTLSDQIKQDLEPLFFSTQWIKVQFRMDNWYLYIWK